MYKSQKGYPNKQMLNQKRPMLLTHMAQLFHTRLVLKLSKTAKAISM
jgi:hypothetical protein